MAYPSVYPTGATIYDPEKCWSGYTVFQAKEVGAIVIDMNGHEVQLWKGLHGFPNKLLPVDMFLDTQEKETRPLVLRTIMTLFRLTGMEI